MNSNEVSRHLPFSPMFESMKSETDHQEEKEYSFFYRNKSKIMIGTAVIISSLACCMLYRYYFKNCVEGFIDDWNNDECVNGEFIPSLALCFPDHSRFKNLIEQCANGEKIQGCFHGKYYRELTEECKYNPAAALCNGNYDYQKDFIDNVSSMLSDCSKS